MIGPGHILKLAPRQLAERLAAVLVFAAVGLAGLGLWRVAASFLTDRSPPAERIVLERD